jgi:elongation factor P
MIKYIGLMLTPTDFKNGLTVKWKGQIWQVAEFLHVKPGKGAAFVRTKLKNVENGGTREESFRMNEQFEAVFVERKEMQYLYAAGDNYAFMDLKSYEQMELTKSELGKDVIDFLKEETVCMVTICEGKIIGVELPNSIELKIIDTAPNEKGNTSSGGTKPATLETGAVINIPFFVENGETIRLNPRTREYQDRVK